jgi:5-hydroxyisourate hydrolase
MSQITTHVLDTSKGIPAQGIKAVLEKPDGKGIWHAVGLGETNADGRILDLLPDESNQGPGFYRIVFDTAAYFERMGVKAFYPAVTITFEVVDQTHYHVPLLLSPFGFSTYRGS